jgi:hypothetical protein
MLKNGLLIKKKKRLMHSAVCHIPENCHKITSQMTQVSHVSQEWHLQPTLLKSRIISVMKIGEKVYAARDVVAVSKQELFLS